MTVKSASEWFREKGWRAHRFQKETWQAYKNGKSGLVNAPTGSGKTYSLWVAMADDIAELKSKLGSKAKGPFAIWVTPLRSLAQEIKQATTRHAEERGLALRIAVRNGDTSAAERRKIKTQPPDMLIITPESLHLLLSTKDSSTYFARLQSFVVDEWHELIGTKRGVQVELARAQLQRWRPELRVWGISATIGNMAEAIQVLLGPQVEGVFIKALIEKQIEVETIIPEDIERMPWSGHLGIKLLPKVIPIIQGSGSTLIFTNTRAQCELWYQHLLDAEPELAGQMAMHHGSIARPIRLWVEEALRNGDAKVVVCTSSLDLGVDFSPVETVIQIGGPKGVSRFMQRAGRSGHRPGAVSRIFFLPTHALELIEASALRTAMDRGDLEARIPPILCFDVLVQFMMTLAVGEGFEPMELYETVLSTYCFADLTWDEFQWLLDFIVHGSPSLDNYPEFKKAVLSDGRYRVENRRIAMRHRMNIGTIVSDGMLHVKYKNGPRIGMVEEWFVSNLSEGDNFWFAGKALKYIRVKGDEIQVRASKAKKAKVPAYMGGRLPMSSQLSHLLRESMSYIDSEDADVELKALAPIIARQREESVIPRADQLLIESFETREGHHVCIYPFEGKFIHEALANLLAYRLSQKQPLSISYATNDYGFELLSDQPIPLTPLLYDEVYGDEGLSQELLKSMNAAELTQRRFRDIAIIAGLLFTGLPGREQKQRHIQASARLFYQVFEEHEPGNLLLRQAVNETFAEQMEEMRLRLTLQRLRQQEKVHMATDRPTPLAFPIMVDRLREKMSSEKLADRIKKMQLMYGS